jgi:hypothetical protein
MNTQWYSRKDLLPGEKPPKTSYILRNVQDAYMACKDAHFVRHAKDKYSKWEQGAPIILQDYMDSALTKYKTLKTKGLWETPSPKQEQIIALTVAFSSLKAKSSKNKENLAKAKQTSQKKAGSDGKPKGPAGMRERLLGRMWLPTQGNHIQTRRLRGRLTTGALTTSTPSGPFTTSTPSQTYASSIPTTLRWREHGRKVIVTLAAAAVSKQ